MFVPRRKYKRLEKKYRELYRKDMALEIWLTLAGFKNVAELIEAYKEEKKNV